MTTPQINPILLSMFGKASTTALRALRIFTGSQAGEGCEKKMKEGIITTSVNKQHGSVGGTDGVGFISNPLVVQ